MRHCGVGGTVATRLFLLFSPFSWLPAVGAAPEDEGLHDVCVDGSQTPPRRTNTWKNTFEMAQSVNCSLDDIDLTALEVGYFALFLPFFLRPHASLCHHFFINLSSPCLHKGERLDTVIREKQGKYRREVEKAGSH